MPDQNPSDQDPTAGYKKSPDGPNFILVVAGFLLTILIVLFLAVLVLRHKGTKMVPHAATPTPNSLIQPAPLSKSIHRLRA